MEDYRQEEQYGIQDQYGNQGYGEQVDTTYQTDDGGYGQTQENYQVTPDGYGQTVDEQRLDNIEQDASDENRDQRREHEGEAAGLLGGGMALYEKHEEKVDPEHARRHKIEEEIAEGVGFGGAGATLYEHHERKEDQEALDDEAGEKRGWF